MNKTDYTKEELWAIIAHAYDVIDEFRTNFERVKHWRSERNEQELCVVCDGPFDIDCGAYCDARLYLDQLKRDWEDHWDDDFREFVIELRGEQ